MKKEKNKPTCIIPARAMSQRVKDKNKLQLGGKSLVEHAILTAIESGLFLCIMVSSDDEKILEIAYKHFNHGLVQPHKRPPRLAQDDVPLSDVCAYLMQLYKTNSNEFCLLIPNSPFRTAADIKKTYTLLKDANYVVTVKPYQIHPQRALSITNGYLKTKYKSGSEQLYYEDAAVIWARTGVFLKEQKLNLLGSKCLPSILPHPTLEIDTQEDLKLAREMWKHF